MINPLRFWTRAPQARRTLLFASATHVWSDLFFALYAPLLPLIKDDLDLTFTEVAMLKSLYAAASAVLQVPVGFMADRVGEFWLLVGGNLWVAVGLIGMALAPSFVLLLAFTLLGGLGGGTQHPLASGIVSRAYDSRARATAVGTVNFAGDLGKMAAPAFALVVAVSYGWRGTMLVIGIGAIAFFLALMFIRRSVEIDRPEPVESKRADAYDGTDKSITGFKILSVVGFIDSAIRAAALTFVPFILEDRGMESTEIFIMLILLLAGGAFGKYLCGWFSERHGLISIVWVTKASAAIFLVATIYAPMVTMAPLMVLLGIGLNGTSSSLYATVASFVPQARRSRMYGFFYTTNEIGSFAAPLAFGRVADVFSIRASMALMGLLAATILPVSLALRGFLRPSPAWEEA
ncbi:MAG: MFS transporter [Dehalococcoidia bacterium]|nr:MFS transporter [Dehalococcoidia bacterium]